MTEALSGQHFLITGGGSGIGLACAARLRADGGVVTLMGRTQQKLDTAAARLRETPGAEVRVAVGDVANEDHIAAAVTVACDVTLDPGVHLRGATSIGRGCRIGPNCSLNDTTLEENVVVAGWTVMDGASVASGATVG